MAQTKHVTLASGALEEVRLIVVDTISDLRGLAAQYQVVRVKGHTAANDGGGGEFVLAGTGATPGDIDSAGDDDNGFYIVNSSGYIWARQSDVVTPQMFGAFPVHTSVAARTASSCATQFQRAVDFYLYPLAFAGSAHDTNPRSSRRFEVPSGFYRCGTTINIYFGRHGDQPDPGYKFADNYFPGELMMRGSVWTPYATDIVGINLRVPTMFSGVKVTLNAVKDVISDGSNNDTTYAKKWTVGTWPQIYFDDTCVRTWANSTKFYRDEDIKYVSSGVTYIIRCTATGTTASATPSDLTGASFTSGGTFYCRGTSRLSSGKNMDDCLHDSRDVGIHVEDCISMQDLTLNALNYAIGVKLQPRSSAGVAWSKINVPQAPGCKVGIFHGSWAGDRIVELGGRLSLTGLPTGTIVWETAWPKAYGTASYPNGYFPGAKVWSSGQSGILLNDLITYKVDEPADYDQWTGSNGQVWVWRVTSAGDGVLGTNAPTSSQCNTTPWQDGTGKPTLTCIGSWYGTRYIYNGGGESTPGNWSDPGSTYQMSTILGWANDNKIHAQYLSPRWQGASGPSIPANTSTYGVVMTGPYSNNNNHYEMIDMSPLQITSWTSSNNQCESAEYLIYTGSQNTFHCRQETSGQYCAAMLCQPRKQWLKPLNNVVRSARNPDLWSDVSLRTHRGGGGANILLGPAELETVTARCVVDFSKSFNFSSYDYIYSRDVPFYSYSSSSTISLSNYIAAGLTSDSASDTIRYFADDDSWQFKWAGHPVVMVDLTDDVSGSYLIRLTPNLGAATYGTSDRWWRWLLTPLEEDGLTKIDPALLADTTCGTGTYASTPLVAEIGNGVGIIQPQQVSTNKYIYDSAPNYSSRTLILAVNPLIKKFLIGLHGKHMRGWTLEVINSPGAKIYTSMKGHVDGICFDDRIRVIDDVPAKGRVTAPSIFRYVDGTSTAAFAKFRGSAGEVYYCTSGNTSGLGSGTARRWGHNGASQGSATISEWNGTGWDTVASNAYYTEPSSTYFEDIPEVIEAHATIYCIDGSTAQTPSQTTWTKVTGFTTDGLEVNCNADAANNRIAITVTGDYEIRGQVSFSADASSTVQWRVYAGSSPAATYIKCSRMLGTGGDVGSASFTGTLSLTAGDYVELWLYSSDATPSITPKDMQLSVHRIG